MKYLNEIAEVNGRQLAPVPIHKVSYKGWTHVYGRDTFDRSCMTLGLSQWVNENVSEGEPLTKIVNVEGKEYVKYIINNFEWQENDLSGEYELFKVGSERRYSKAWIPYDSKRVSDGLYLLRDAHSSEPGYILVKKDAVRACISLLDPWYVSSGEIYTIMYALNYENGTPAKFRIKEMGDYFVLFYPSRLPEEENKLFFSLSWPYRNCHDKFARVFPEQTMNIVTDEIDSIGASISS